MSFAATSIRGARLNARFAVKGIHSSSSDGSVADSASEAESVSVAMGIRVRSTCVRRDVRRIDVYFNM